jgi:hypothetical protein
MSRCARRALWVLCLLPCAWPTEARAQALTPAVCPLPPDVLPDPDVLPWKPALLRPPLDAVTPPPPGVPPTDIPLLRRTIDTALFPNARCNDGTPAVLYIRPAHAAYAGNPIVTPSSQWIIFLDGGGGCRDAEACAIERWCGYGGQVFDRAGKMTSGLAPDAIQGHGIFALDPPGAAVNQFRTYNHVIVNYCSSDNWIGSAKHQGLTTSYGASFDIEFRGQDIVDAVVATLLAGPTAADPAAAAGFYATPLPSLQGATRILLGGESAGGNGLRHHLDRLAGTLQPPTTNQAVDVRGVVDAGVPPHLGLPTIDWSDSFSPGDYADHLKSEVEPTVRTFWGANDQAIDQSCLDAAWAPAHAAAGGHPRVCYDATYTLLNHITTPVFLREDLNDPLGKQRYTDWHLYPSADSYWTDLFAQLTTFAGFPGTAGLEAPAAAPGVHAPNCGRHVAIQTDNGFYYHGVLNPGTPSLSFHDLLWNWVSGVAAGPNTQQIQVDTAPPAALYSPSDCTP